MKEQDLKNKIIKYSYEHQMTHLGSNLTAVGIIQEIYEKKKHDDKVVISAGHYHLAHSVVAGLIPGVHCDKELGCDISTGSLGMGISISVGLALADRTKNVWCLISDGEASEGVVFESLRVAQEQNLTNLKVYCNANGYGAFKEIDVDLLEKRLNAFFPVKVIRTHTEGLADHYRLVTEEEYGKITNK